MGAKKQKARDADFREEKEDYGKTFDIKLFKKLWFFVKPHKKYFYLSLILLTLATGFQLFFPYLTRISIDTFMEREDRYSLFLTEVTDSIKVSKGIYLKEDPKGEYELQYSQDGFFLEYEQARYILTPDMMQKLKKKDLEGIDLIVIVMVLILSGLFFSSFFQVYYSNLMGQRVILDVRKKMFSHLLKLPLSFFDKNPTGRILTRVTNDTQNLNDFFTEAITSIIKDVLLLAGILIFLFLLSVSLTGYTMIIIPVIILATYLFRIFSRKAYRKVRTRLAKINAFLAEHLSGVSVIQLFNRETAKLEEFKGVNQSYYKATMLQLLVFAIFRPVMDILFYLALCIVIWFGAGDLVAGSLTFGTLYAFISYIDMFFQPLRDISEKFDIVQNAFASAEKIFKLLDEDKGTEIETKTGKETFNDNSIEFRDVFFSYDGIKDVLINLSFKIKSGEKIAVVGETGAGKTSLISILTGLYPIQKGRILIGDTSIYEYDIHALRRKVGIVLQDVFIFSGNVIDNIRLFNENISEKEAIEAAKFVHVDKMIERFEKGFYTELNERASTLSAGERQLIALARAVVSKPDILILDEATSNIDPVTESLIQDAMEKISKNKTVITIAHRLSTIRNSDRILVMHKSRLVEEGTHEVLLKKKGIYSQLYKIQYEL